MIAYHGDAKLKEQFVAEIKMHSEADHFLQGIYGFNSDSPDNGCAVGCAIATFNKMFGHDWETDDHKRYEEAIGVPEVLARLEDALFEKLSAEESKKWPLRFAEAVPVGADLSNVINQFFAWLLSPEEFLCKIADARGKAAISTVHALYARKAGGDEVTDEEWNAARTAVNTAAYAADVAARTAAYAAAHAVDRCASTAVNTAARTAARTAAYAADAVYAVYAAYAAACTAADAAAYAAALKMADKLIELIEQAPIVQG